MKNKLEEFVHRNRNSFDSELPAGDVWKNIETTPVKQHRKILYFLTRTQAAASLLVLVNDAILIFMLQRKPVIAPVMKQAAPVEQATGSKGPAPEETIDQISKVVELKQARLLEIKSTNPLLYKKFTTALDQLNIAYKDLEKELNNNPNKEQLLEAMIQNLSLQQELLNQQLSIYQKIKQTKNEKISKNI